MNIMLNELIGKVETLKLQNVRQRLSICFLRYSDILVYDYFFFENVCNSI